MSARITAVMGDITQFEADAIVNAANNSLLGGGGVDGAIHRAAGPGLYDECARLRGCDTGDAKVTGAHDMINCGLIVHTVGPVWHGGNKGEAKLLASCYRRSIEEAVAHGARTVAFPSISTGIYGYPVERAAKIAVEVCTELADELDAITFVCFDPETYGVYSKLMQQH